jgi:hypothetical protein
MEIYNMARQAYDRKAHDAMLESYARVQAQLRALSEVTRRNSKEYHTVLSRVTMRLRRQRTRLTGALDPKDDPEVKAARALWEYRKRAIDARVGPLMRRKRELKAALTAMGNALLMQASRVR